MISSSLMAPSTTPLFLLFLSIFTTFPSQSLLALANTIPSSTISAAPAILPDISPISPSSSSSPPPALSPDIYPLFPSPGGSELSPSDSSMPIIPSSPSPPNPDAMAASGSGSAFSPSGLLPDSASVKIDVPGFLMSSMAVLFFLRHFE